MALSFRYFSTHFALIKVSKSTKVKSKVVGAFAISTNIIIIMIGLGIGAMFVRSLTIMFVERKTLGKYIYLEHGAHYAIGFLASILLLKIFIHIPEWFSGSVGIIILAISFVHSVVNNKNKHIYIYTSKHLHPSL